MYVWRQMMSWRQIAKHWQKSWHKLILNNTFETAPTTHIMANHLANDFLNTIFEDRHVQLEDAIRTYDTGELSNIVDRFASRTTALQHEKFRANLDLVVVCVAFKRSCGTGVGRWMNTNCPTWDGRKCDRIIEMCKFSAGIYKNWEVIKHNLTNSSMRDVDARDFSLRRLYEARKSSWCRGERRQHPPCEPSPQEIKPTREYDEQR